MLWLASVMVFCTAQLGCVTAGCEREFKEKKKCGRVRMGQRKNTRAFPRVRLTPGHSKNRGERAKRKKKKELYYAVEEGGEQDEFMLNAPMKQPSGPNESNRRCINTPGEASTRIHTHTSTDNSNKLSVRFLCCWLRPKMRYYKKMGKTLFWGFVSDGARSAREQKDKCKLPCSAIVAAFRVTDVSICG